ncbi:MAG: hypothetical protein GY850_27975 [bacterium]|nr:hypothetical protein [bacterium]
MTPEQWQRVRYFNPGEKWGDPERVDPELIFTLDAYRDFVGKPVHIHCGYIEQATGYHSGGLAVDCHVVGLSVFDQFIAAQRFVAFRGIGLYPYWNNPGLHLDTRAKGRNKPRSLWGAVAPKEYVAVTKEFMYQCY